MTTSNRRAAGKALPTSDRAGVQAGRVGGSAMSGSSVKRAYPSTEADDMRWATIAEHLASGGFGLFRLAVGGYLIARRDCNVERAAVDNAAARFIRRVGGLA